MTATTTDVTRTLARYVEPVHQEMLRFLPSGPQSDYLSEPTADYPTRPAKGLRPGILIASCVTHGGTEDDALLPAASIELLHNALLIHDDIQDGSELRRGRPALHQLIGEPLAINAGDALAMYALEPLHESVTQLGSRLGSLLLDEFRRMTRYSLEGQALELGWTRDNVVELGDDDYLRLIMLKTCWYTTIYPLRVGALIGARGRTDLDDLISFGWFLGAAFQIRDDLLNLKMDVERYGKEALGDLFEGKRTMPLIHLMRTAPPTVTQRVRSILDRPRDQRQLDDVVWIKDQMVHAGSIEYTEAFANGIASSAHGAFEAAFAGVHATPARDFLQGLITYMLEREE